MANLSDLLGAARGETAVPQWIAAMRPAGGFRALAEEEIEEPQPEPEPSPDPGAEMDAALADAYARGQADARLAFEAQQADDTAGREGLTLAFSRLDNAARLALAEQLAEQVANLCSEVIEPVLIDRAALAARCTTLMDSIGDVTGQLTLHLHPDDVSLLDDSVPREWSIHRDPALPRGTLLLAHADGALADGPEEWRRLIAAALAS